MKASVASRISDAVWGHR